MIQNENQMSSKLIVSSNYFHISLQSEKLSVVLIKNEYVPKIAWWLIKEYGLKSKRSSLFNSLLMDDDGLSLVCDTRSLSTLKFLIKEEEFTVSPQLWRSLIINVTGTAFDFPGAVYFLANTLSSEGLSIFHISTFESEVFLIQDDDVEIATTILRDTEKGGRINNILGSFTTKDNKEDVSNQTPPIMTAPLPIEDDHIQRTSLNIEDDNSEGEEEDEVNLDMSWITPNINKGNASIPSTTVTFRDNFHLSVLPNSVMLAKFSNDFDLSDCSNILINMLLYDKRFSPLERLEENNQNLNDSVNNIDSSSIENDFTNDVKNTNSYGNFMWGIWNYDDELTMLMEESDIEKFPRNALILSPQKWRIIKLCGRPIAFDETGIVSSMSKIEASIPSLNISTATTNCTLVPDELLDATLISLSQVLNCEVKGL